ncbi:hypothetical protein E2C01_007974 [Portunus trituberculatus]|uniref:Uncharacterized protein n=1 Tax=Portunus trituberculatus TaxID=210409 RepID=A0A5B7D0E3_PORTR|nr:hypothetical protein [Portunus trituberculatus]
MEREYLIAGNSSRDELHRGSGSRHNTRTPPQLEEVTQRQHTSRIGVTKKPLQVQCMTDKTVTPMLEVALEALWNNHTIGLRFTDPAYSQHFNRLHSELAASLRNSLASPRQIGQVRTESQIVVIFHESKDLTRQNTTLSPTAAGRGSHQTVSIARWKHNFPKY